MRAPGICRGRRPTAARHWTNIKQGIIEDSDVFSIIVDPKQPNVVYLSACSGIYKSEDAGAKFTGGVGMNKTQGIPSTARRTRVLMQDPNNLNTVFAGTTEGLYRTFDAGKFWMQTTGLGPDCERRVCGSGELEACAAGDRPRAACWRATMAATVLCHRIAGSRRGRSRRLPADAQHPATVYVGVVNDKDSGGVFVSHTGGLSWSHLSDGLDGHDVFSLGQAPDGTILAGTEHGIYRLKDCGLAARGRTTRRPPRRRLRC